MNVVFAIVGGIALIVCLSLLLAVPVWLLWNACLVGAVAGVSEVTLLQAWGLNLLAGLMFKTNVTTKK
jgi:hypothetical protein